MSVKIALRFVGLAFLQQTFANIIQSAEQEHRRGKWYVVSVVKYAEILEWDRPHWRVAIQQLADEYALSTSEQQESLNMMIAGGNMSKKLAEKLAARIRRMIREQKIIETGNYLASIAAGSTLEEAISLSTSQLLDPSTAIGMEVV